MNTSKNKKILVLGPLGNTIGGITTYIRSLIHSDLNNKYIFDTFGTERPSTLVPKEIDDYSNIFRIGFIFSIKSILITIKHIIQFPITLLFTRPDVVHIHTSHYWSFLENSIYMFFSKILSYKTILHIHGSKFDSFYLNSNTFMKIFIRCSLTVPDKNIVLSPRWKIFFRNLVEDRKIVIIPNFVDYKKYKQSSDNKINQGPTKIVFMYGTSVRRKGMYEVLRSIPKITEKNEDIIFYFIGDPNLPKIKKIVDERKLNKYIKFMGYVDEDLKIEILTSSDIYILPSHAEGLPISILEAMSAGLAIVSTNVGAIPEVIENGVNGYLINKGDYVALADKISILLNDKNHLNNISYNNTEKIKNNYDLNYVLEKMDKEYNNLIYQ